MTYLKQNQYSIKNHCETSPMNQLNLNVGDHGRATWCIFIFESKSISR